MCSYVCIPTVQRSLGVDGRAAVYVSTQLGASSGTAVAGRDFKALFNRSLVWQDGDDLEKELYVQVLNDGQPQEQPKTFTLFLHDANGAQINPERSQTQVVLVAPANRKSLFISQNFPFYKTHSPLYKT